MSAPSEATGRYFPDDEVFQPHDRTETALTVRALLRSPELRDRAAHAAQRRIWQEHTYTHRAMDIMSSLGVTHTNPLEKSCTVFVSTYRPGQLDHILQSVAEQVDVDVQLSLVTHGHSIDDATVQAKARELGIANVVVQSASSALSLGECLNLAIASADGDVLAKFDDDDLYGRHYLADQMAALRYSAADLVGKQAHYMHLEDSGAVLLRFPEREHKFTDLVMGPTMVGSRETFLELPFAQLTRGEDTTFQQKLVYNGGTVYSADRYNFVQVRSVSGAHTWTVETSELMANSVVHGYGLARDHHFF